MVAIRKSQRRRRSCKLAKPAEPSHRRSLIPRFIRQQTAVDWVILLSLSVLLASALVVTRIAERADNQLHDAFSRLVPAPMNDDILIVTIDNDSLKELGYWPWPRAVHAKALDTLATARPHAVIYDVLFLDPAPSPEDDTALARAMGTASPVYLPLLLQAPGAMGRPVDVSQPIAPLTQAAAGLGHVMALPDDDGVLRRAKTTLRIGEQCWPHLAYMAESGARGRRPACGPVDSEVLIPFAGPAGTYPAISFATLIKGEIAPEFLTGKIVLVGAMASGLGDQYATPMQGRTDLMSGVELEANLVAALLKGNGRSELPVGWTLVLTIVPVLALWAGFHWLPPRANLLLAAFLLIILPAVSGWLLVAHNLWFRSASAMFVVAFMLPVWGWLRLSAASRYLVSTLERLREEPGLLGQEVRLIAATDRVERQMILLHDTVRQIRDLKHFAEEIHASLPDATLIARSDGQIVLANERARHLGQLHALGLSGNSLASLLHGLRPRIEDGNEAFEALVDNLEAGRAAELEAEIDLDNGSAFLLRIRPCLGADGTLSFFIVRMTDISELRAAARQRDTMLQLLTHDMKSPVASILALMDGPAGKDIPPAVAGRIESHARKTLGLADEFVQIARAEAAAHEVELLDLRDVAHEAADDFWVQAQAKRITVTVDDGDDELLVRADHSLLARAIGNLVSNAIKYGRTTVHIRTVAESEPLVACMVEDDGRGLSQNEIGQLFRRFGRLSPLKTDEDGVGLGLVLVRTVATGHGGTISCESEPGKGCRFTLRLPRVVDQGCSA